MKIFRKRKGSSQVRPALLYKVTITAWLLSMTVTALIFYIFMPGYGISSAILEAAASWTGTGISAYDSDSVPVLLQLFRSVCNWIGGAGIIMTALTVLHPRRFMGWTLAASEFPGPDFLKSETDFRRNYRRIVVIYAGLSVLQFILLIIAGMAPVQALMSALSNTSSAGLHHINNGVVTALSLPVKIILTVFAFLCSVNSAVFIHILRRKWKDVRGCSELKVYVLRILVAGALIFGFIIAGNPEGASAEAAGSVLMQVISTFSTSGFIVSDVSSWPAACTIILFVMSFAGACSLSTGGGFKIGRLIIAVKTCSYGLYKHVHPNSVRTLTFDKKSIKSESVVSANLFIALFMITYLLGALLLSLDSVGLTEALCYSQAMITNTGICIGSSGAAGMATGFGAFGRVVMSVLMVAGRLEIYPLLMLLFRSFWKSE